MQKSRKKKGFTLTELAIVIAVIAILIAVLVPTFTSLINKARESADSQLAKNMNTLLATAEAEGNEPERMDQVNEILVAGGYTIAKLSPTADGNIFVWNSDTNRISYIDEDHSVLYAGDSSLTTDGTFKGGNNYWLTVESISTVETWAEDYQLSYYIASSSFKDATLTFTYAAGVDTGSYTVGAISYGTDTGYNVKIDTAKTAVGGNNAKKATADTNATITAVIRGKIGNLTVDNSGIYVENYASITDKTTVSAATKYTENGYSNELAVSNNVTVEIANNGMVDTLSGSSTNITNYGYIDTVSASEGGSINVSATDKNSYVYSISNYSELAAFRDKVNGGMTFAGLKVELTADIDISSRVWVPIGYDSRDNAEKYHSAQTETLYYYFAGTFNGNGHTISGLTNTGFTPTTTRVDTYGTGSATADKNNYLYGLFGIINGAVIRDLTMTNVNIVEEETYLDSVGAIAGFGSGSITITNCKVYGSINATDAAAGIIGRIYTFDGVASATKTSDGSLQWGRSINTSNSSANKTVAALNTTQTSYKITNCKNYASITITKTDNTTSKAGGIAGYINNFTTGDYAKTIEISNCENYGNISANIYTAGIASTTTGSAISFTNCVNTGNVTSTNEGSDRTSNAGSIVSDDRNGTNSGTAKTNIEVSWTISNCTNSGTITSNGTTGSKYGYVFGAASGTYSDTSSYTITYTGSSS